MSFHLSIFAVNSGISCNYISIKCCICRLAVDYFITVSILTWSIVVICWFDLWRIEKTGARSYKWWPIPLLDFIPNCFKMHFIKPLSACFAYWIMYGIWKVVYVTGYWTIWCIYSRWECGKHWNVIFFLFWILQLLGLLLDTPVAHILLCFWYSH